MKYTANKNLKLPEYTDVVDVEDLNENFETIDAHFGESVVSEEGAHGFRYDEENQKLEAKTSTGEWEEISLGVDVSGVTATADKVLTGYKFVGADGVLTDGTMANKGSGSGTISTVSQSIAIPAGYYDGNGSVSISTTEQAKIIPGNIAEGVTLLGVTGTHSSGLKVVTGSVNNFTISSGYGRSITISNPGIVTKYAIVNFKANGNQVSHGYDLTTSKHLIPDLNATQLSAYMHSYTSEGYVSANSVNTLSFYLFYTDVNYYSTSYSVTNISYILIGE